VATIKQRKALALGSGITLLGVLRALGQAGVETLALPDTDEMPRRSKWYRAAPVGLSAVRPETLGAALSSVEWGTVLIPCSDQWVKAVAGLPQEVRRDYPASVPSLAALETLVDKGLFRATLEKLSLPHPATISLSSVADIEPIAETVLAGAFLKPAQSQQFFARFGVKAFRFVDRRDAIQRLSTCIDAGFEMMLQQYIPGPASSHYFIDGFIDRHGEARAMFARRRLRMSPPDFGNSTFMISIPMADVAEGANTLRALFAEIGYRGVFSAEFKRDERDGILNLIEVNARPWWYVDFAARCGVNVCALAIRDAVGEDVETISSYKVGRRCVFPYYDLEAVRRETAAGRLGWLGWARSWIGPFQPVFRWSDPAPALGEVAALARKRFSRSRSR
jgi:D-aspartate ligase